ncbi:hypothetical protein JT739_01915 [Tepidanaerobacter sp. GT38]|uniref:hypothetical protein n=1 Tax=Tepidanaerobacter sp. GT38 TaxID=2722793 RepID=UPI001F17662F|nr:hypothetical protein [Tepidanaerobacter sp. GT38]MCG1011345.1 hypothetical protein [Tepidanaerobacter sp. GT38]
MNSHLIVAALYSAGLLLLMGIARGMTYSLWPRITLLSWVIWLVFILLELGWEAQIVDWSLLQIWRKWRI